MEVSFVDLENIKNKITQLWPEEIDEVTETEKYDVTAINKYEVFFLNFVTGLSFLHQSI